MEDNERSCTTSHAAASPNDGTPGRSIDVKAIHPSCLWGSKRQLPPRRSARWHWTRRNFAVDGLQEKRGCTSGSIACPSTNTCQPCMPTHRWWNRHGSDGTTSRRWTPPSVATNRPSHVRSNATWVQYHDDVTSSSTPRRTCAHERVRSIRIVLFRRQFSRTVANRSEGSSMGEKKETTCDEGIRCDHAAACRHRMRSEVYTCIVHACLHPFPFALFMGSTTVGWRRCSHRLVRWFRPSLDPSRSVPRFHASVSSVTCRSMERHAGMDGAVHACHLLTRRGCRTTLSRVVVVVGLHSHLKGAFGDLVLLHSMS